MLNKKILNEALGYLNNTEFPKDKEEAFNRINDPNHILCELYRIVDTFICNAFDLIKFKLNSTSNSYYNYFYLPLIREIRLNLEEMEVTLKRCKYNEDKLSSSANNNYFSKYNMNKIYNEAKKNIIKDINELLNNKRI